MSATGPEGRETGGDAEAPADSREAPFGGRSTVRPSSPAGTLRPAERGTLPPERDIPKHVLEHARVVQGARAPGEPPPAPAPPSVRSLPKLPRASGAPPARATPAPPPAREPSTPPVDVLASLERALPPESPTLVPQLSPGPRRSPMQMPAICGYGRFEILGRVAFGGMAEIFLGRESTSVGATRLLAIKRILPHVADDPQFVEMFLDEARLAIQLTHPQICHIYEFGELEGSYFIAMEWIHGAQLGKVIRRARARGGMDPELAARIIAYVAEALHHAHRARDANGEPLGIVHRDVSPHNVMISYDGQVKLLDFGIAKAGSHTTKTQAGVVKGKFSYMSPQQCLGKPIDARADVFALGICLYETLTGASLYHRSTEYETMRAVIEDPVPSIRDVHPDLPIELDAIVQKALQKDPGERFQSAGDMQMALEDWLARTGRAINTARIAKMMEMLFEEQIQAGPLVDSTPFGESFRRRPTGGAKAAGIAPEVPIDVTVPEAEPVRVAAPARSRTALYAAGAALAAIALVAVGVVAGGAMERPRPPTPPVASAPPPEPTPDPMPTPVPPPTVPEAAPTHGTLALALEPSARGATITIGDRTIAEGAQDAPIELPPGTHLVHVEREGHRPWDREIEVRAGEETPLEIALVELPRAATAPPGTISINTRPWSKVYVGPRLLGTTPIGEARVPSGSVRLRIVDRDGRTFTRSVRVPAGGTESVFYDLDEQ